MIPRSALLAVFVMGSGPAPAEPLISQYYEGSSFDKWIELSNTSAVPLSLAGYRLTRWTNASTEAWKSGGGTPSFTQSLDDFSIPGNGFLLISHPSAANPDYVTADLTSDVINVNGDDSLVLYDTSRGAVGDPAAIVDALSFVTRPEGENKSFYRLGTGQGYDLNFGSTVLSFPTVWGEKSTAEVGGAALTDDWRLKNFASTATDSLSVTLSPTSIAENGGSGLVDVTVTRSGPTAAALNITLESGDESEAVIPVPNRQIPAGQASATFSAAIDAVDDSLADLTQTVIITARAAGLSDGTAELLVTDDGDVAPIAINEILADPPSGLAGDANGDGTGDTSDDEFVEIVNLTGADLDISLWELHDGAELRHTFPSGTILPPDCAVVVFGGGSTDQLGGSALYQVVNTARLALNNGGDTVTVFDDQGNAVASEAYGAEGGNNQSLTKDPDLTGSLALHTSAAGSAGAAFSPGTRVNGSEFCPPDGQLSISLSATSMNENGGSLTATIRRTGDLSAALDILVKIDDATEAEADLVSPERAVIPAGEFSIEVTIKAVDDVAPDGTQPVVLRVIAPRYGTGTANFDVEDDGDGAFTAIIINEILSDPPEQDINGDGVISGTEDEFVELINVSGTPFDLSGYELHDAFGLRHIFAPGTVLVDGRAVIVFGGGFPSGAFGGSLVQTASSGMLGLNNDGDTLTLKTPGGGSDLLEVTYDGAVFDESLTRDPDLTGSFVAHSAAAGSAGALTSPGTRVDGEAFAGGIAAGTIRIELFEIDVAAEEITVQVAGLLPVINYFFDVSLDLNEFDPWFGLETFTTADGTEVSPGVFQFVFFDPFISGEDSQYYRIRQP